jgi:archaellum component FlaC
MSRYSPFPRQTNPLPSITASIKNTFKSIKTTISREQISESTTLFLQIIECTATLVPVFGPVIVLGAQIAQLPGQYDDLKKKIDDFSSDVYENASLVEQVTKELNQMFSDNMNKISNIHDIHVIEEQLQKLKRSSEFITMALSDYESYIKPKFNKDSNTFNMTVLASSTETIESKIDSFRISLLNGMSVFLFQIQSIMITTISDITTAIQNTNTQVQMNIETIEKITQNLNDLKSELQAVKDNFQDSKNGELNNAVSPGVSTSGGYKFKSKKIKRKLNKIKRKTKNNRKTKNKRKTKKYI